MLCVEQLLVIAGPTASGKSVLLQSSRLQEIVKSLGIEDVREWPIMDWLAVRSTDIERRCLILHLDLVWGPYALREEPPGGKTAASILAGARELFFVTLWTPPARLESQFLASRLCAPVPPNFGGHLRAALFRPLPRSVIRGLSRLPLLDRFNRWLPRTALLRGLLAVRIYSSPVRVAALYRRWLHFCDGLGSKTRGHVIVEYDRELKIYSREQWEDRIRADDRS